jgi:hypothetical protein
LGKKADSNRGRKDQSLRSGYGVKKSRLDQLKTKSWFDEDCVALKTEVNMGGMNISMIEVPKKKAKKMDAEVKNFC